MSHPENVRDMALTPAEALAVQAAARGAAEVRARARALLEAA